MSCKGLSVFKMAPGILTWGSPLEGRTPVEPLPPIGGAMSSVTTVPRSGRPRLSGAGPGDARSSLPLRLSRERRQRLRVRSSWGFTTCRTRNPHAGVRGIADSPAGVWGRQPQRFRRQHREDLANR